MAASSSSDVVTLFLPVAKWLERKGEEFLEVEVVLQKGLPC